MRYLFGGAIINIILWGFFWVGLGVSQEPEPDPHQNQPATCRNIKDPLVPDAPLCKCREDWDKESRCQRDYEDIKCQVYCRKNACHCDHRCES